MTPRLISGEILVGSGDELIDTGPFKPAKDFTKVNNQKQQVAIEERGGIKPFK